MRFPPSFSAEENNLIAWSVNPIRAQSETAHFNYYKTLRVLAKLSQIQNETIRKNIF